MKNANTRSEVTKQFACLALGTKYEAIPAAAIESAKLRFLDTIGLMLAGSRLPAALMSLTAIRPMGGHPVASVAGHRYRTSAPLAGYLNGVSAGAPEYDDFSKGADTHLSSSLVPGALVVAEQLGIPGRKLLEAFVVGFEVGARIGRGMSPYLFNHGWHANGVTGAIGVAISSARMLDLDEMQTRMAVGIAASEAAGVRKNVGSMGKAFHVGHGVRNGIFAASLAQAGFQVDPDIIEGEDVNQGHNRFGLLDTFNGIGNYHLDRMTSDLGQEWELAENRTLVRLHPCSTAPSPAIDAMIELANEHNLGPQHIERVDLETTPRCVAIACYAEATTPNSARFCLPFLMAVALIDRKVGLPQFDAERISRGDVQELAARVHVSIPEDFLRHSGTWGEDGINWGEARLTIYLKDGRVLRAARSTARGWSEDPAGWQDLVTKYRECTDGIVPPSQAEDAIAMIHDLEKLPDVRELMAALRPTGEGDT